MKNSYQDASKVSNSIPCCSIGLKRNVRGKGTFAAKVFKKSLLKRELFCMAYCLRREDILWEVA